MNNDSTRNWKRILGSQLHSRENLQFYVSPDIPKKIFTNCIKSYAKYVTSRGDKILALYDGGRSGKEGFALTEQGISFNDAYGNFGGSSYDNIESFCVEKAGDPEHPFPLFKVNIRDGSLFRVSFLENPQAASILTEILDLIIRENKSAATAARRGLSHNEKWVDIIEQYLPHMPLEGLYKAPYIPEHLINNSISGYAGEIEPDEVVALFEYRTHGHEGFLLSHNGLIYKMGYENWGSLSYDIINEVEYSVQKLLNNDVPAVSLRTRDGRHVELQFIIHPKVASHFFDILEKGILLNKTENAISSGKEAQNIEEMITLYLPHDPANRIFKSPEIPDTLCACARTAWGNAFSSPDGDLLLFYDNSPGGTGESGCILTRGAFFFKSDRGKINKLKYESLEKYYKDSGRHHNNIIFVSAENESYPVSFYLFKKAQDAFLYFLRQGFPDKEEAFEQGVSEAPEKEAKKYVYTSKRSISESVPTGLSLIILIISCGLIAGKELSWPIFLLELLLLFLVILLGLTLISMKKDYLKVRKYVKKIPRTLIKDTHFREREPVKIAGTALSGTYTLENECLYREKILKNGSPPPFAREILKLSNLKKELFWQSIPFYLEDGTGRVLLLIQDSLVGIFGREEKELHPGDLIYAFGTLIKNPMVKEFPEADYALTGGRSGKDFPLVVSDNDMKLGASHYDTGTASLEMITGWIFIALGGVGYLLLFLWKRVSGETCINLIMDLFR